MTHDIDKEATPLLCFISNNYSKQRIRDFWQKQNENESPVYDFTLLACTILTFILSIIPLSLSLNLQTYISQKSKAVRYAILLTVSLKPQGENKEVDFSKITSNVMKNLSVYQVQNASCHTSEKFNIALDRAWDRGKEQRTCKCNMCHWELFDKKSLWARESFG